jgi:hypothetical protein
MNRHADVLAAYNRLRQVRFDLNSTLVETLDKRAIDEGASKLGLLRRGMLVFESEEEMPALMDYCIHNFRDGGRNAARKYLEESPPPPGSEERAVLTAMLKSYYSLFQVLDVARGVGVTVQDLLRGDTAFLADIGFGGTAEKGAMLAARVIPMEGFLMTSGASLPVHAPAMVQIRKGLERTFAPETDFTRLTPQQEADLAALVIRACLASGVASHFAYAMPGQEPSRRRLAGGVSERPRANRNDPCPCGSGKKFKNCCGRR